ncbi:MAG TPA: hypothetical protein VKB69_04865 [Micromonosporaceae bacterium]|nr:hypothetical protein [Micromonosporaceae bacterium]
MAELGELAALRIRAQEAIATKHYDRLLELSSELRADHEYWATWFAPECAVAARATGRSDARAYLDEAILGGFAQYEMFPQLVMHFSVDDDWSDLAARMDANIPQPPLEILDWPVPTPTLPLDLDALPEDRANELRGQLPPGVEGSAWQTAQGVLGWVTQRWAPGTGTADSRDAIDVLARVAAGERFTCVEYTIVLSQALNARGIPARSVGLMMANYHAGFGRGHNVTEAWIDDLGKWVLLDGQNGLYWCAEDDTPLGLRELQQRHAEGRRARATTTGRLFAESEQDFWWRLFHTGTVGGRATTTWRSGAYVPAFESQHVATCTYLLRDPDACYPDLADIAVGISAIGGGPHLLMHTAHPYALGFQVMLDGYAPVRVPVDQPRWRFAGGAGENSAVVAVRTPYGTLRGSQVRYLIRD